MGYQFVVSGSNPRRPSYWLTGIVHAAIALIIGVTIAITRSPRWLQIQFVLTRMSAIFT